jgi:hypothetical protein
MTFEEILKKLPPDCKLVLDEVRYRRLYPMDGGQQKCEVCGEWVRNLDWRTHWHVHESTRRRRERREEARQKFCPVCKRKFKATRRDGMFCCSACKQKAYRKRVTDTGLEKLPKPPLSHLFSSKLHTAWRNSKAQLLPLPPEAVRLGVGEVEHVKNIAALCFELERLSDGEPWSLSSQDAALLVGCDDVAFWLSFFVDRGLLELVEAGKKQRYSRYRWKREATR